MVTLYHGDCLDVLPTLATQSVDLVVTDPPYFLPAKHYVIRNRTARSLSDLSMLEHFYRTVFTELRRVLVDGGHAYVFCDGQSYPAFYVCAYPHFKTVRPLVWDKQTSINGFGWRHQHELIMFCESEASQKIPTGDGDILRYRAVPVGDREHLAQKPIDLLTKIIGKHGGTVIDPFMGSGSTGVAAVQSGCDFIGIESDPVYFELAQRQISAAQLPSGSGEQPCLPF